MMPKPIVRKEWKPVLSLRRVDIGEHCNTDRTVLGRTVRSNPPRHTPRSDRSPKNGPIFHLTPLFQHEWRNQVIRYIYLVDGFKGRATTKPGHDIIAKQMGLLLR